MTADERNTRIIDMLLREVDAAKADLDKANEVRDRSTGITCALMQMLADEGRSSILLTKDLLLRAASSEVHALSEPDGGLRVILPSDG